MDMLGQHIATASVRAFLEDRTGVNLSGEQIRNLRLEVRDRHLVTLEGSESPPQTAADRLLKQVELSTTTSWIALFAEYDTDLVTIPKVSARAQNKADMATHKVYNSTIGEVYTATELENVRLGNATESPVSYANNIRKALAVSGTSKILLAMAWTTDEAQRLAEMFPEVTCTDITEKTTSENRPLILDASSDSENANFTSTFAYLPSKARWVFDWYTSVAKPTLHSRRTITGNQLNLTDEDPNEYGAFMSHSGDNAIYCNAHSRFCAWHKVNRNLRKKLSSSLEKLGPIGKAEFIAVEKWLYSITENVESVEELDESMRLLNVFLDEPERTVRGHMSPAVVAHVKSFVTEKFKPKLMFLAKCHFMHIRSLGVRTTSISESENSAYKRSSIGPKPCQSLDVSQKSVSRVSELRNRQKLTSVAASVDSQPSHEADRERFISGLTRYANDDVIDQFEEQDHYHAQKENLPATATSLARTVLGHLGPCQVVALFYVKRKSHKPICYDHPNPLFWLSVVVKFLRTRTVFVVERNGALFLVCSCCHFEQHGRPCRHIYRVLNRSPRTEDVHVRWLKIYAARYGRDPELTRLFNDARDHPAVGPQCNLDELVEDGFHSNFEFFRCTLLRSVVRTEGTYWDQNPQRLSVTVAPTNSSLRQQPLFGVEQTVRLSQEARANLDAARAANDENEDYDCFANNDHDDIGSEEEGMEDVDEQMAEIQCLLKQQGGAFNLLNAKFQGICDNVRTAEQGRHALNAFDELHSKLLELSFQSSASTSAAMGTASLPAVDRSRDSSRIRKRSSPHKKKSKPRVYQVHTV